jgi:hypothetical protein
LIFDVIREEPSTYKEYPGRVSYCEGFPITNVLINAVPCILDVLFTSKNCPTIPDVLIKPELRIVVPERVDAWSVLTFAIVVYNGNPKVFTIIHV